MVKVSQVEDPTMMPLTLMLFLYTSFYNHNNNPFSCSVWTWNV